MDLTIKKFFTATLQAAEDKKSEDESPRKGGAGTEKSDGGETNCSVLIPRRPAWSLFQESFKSPSGWHPT